MKLSKLTLRTLTAITVYGSVYSINANAFYYEEHKLVTQLALELAINSGNLVVNQADLNDSLSSTLLCPELLDPNPPGCFTLADLPALAGDHAGSPMLLQWKWFNDTLKPSFFFWFTDYFATARVVTEGECQSSETTKSKNPKRSKFASLVHRSPEATSFAEATDVDGLDSNYVRSAAHNCNHFRNMEIESLNEYEKEIGLSYPTDIWKKPFLFPNFIAAHISSVQSEHRTRLKPKLEAGVWYAQLHATALELASHGGQDNLAAAWLFESFALHFIQDGVSSGHIKTPNIGGLSITKTKKTHDHYSNKGLNVSISGACKGLKSFSTSISQLFPNLSKECINPSQETILFGDRNLVKQSESVTKDLAIFLTYVSLTEFGDAMKEKKPLLDEQTLAEDYSNDPHWTFGGQSNEKLTEILFAWWENGGRKEESSPMASAAEKHYKSGNIAALQMWPIAVKN